MRIWNWFTSIQRIFGYCFISTGSWFSNRIKCECFISTIMHSANAAQMDGTNLLGLTSWKWKQKCSSAWVHLLPLPSFSPSAPLLPPVPTVCGCCCIFGAIEIWFYRNTIRGFSLWENHLRHVIEYFYAFEIGLVQHIFTPLQWSR